MTTNNSQHYFLQGGGEMGDLIRSKNWSDSSFGDPSTWPQTLKTLLGVMLDNPFGMCILWGENYLQLYNDGFRSILGNSKHPQALGNSIKNSFAEVWQIIGPMCDNAMDGKAVFISDLMLPLDRDGRIEQSYFDFAASPIRLETEDLGGVLLTIKETTAIHQVQKNLEDHKNELEFAIEAAQLGTFDYNPQTNTFSCNDRSRKWFSLPCDEQIELGLAIDAIVESDRDRIMTAISNVLDYSSGGYFDMVFNLAANESQDEIILNAKGRAWYDNDQVAYRFNGTIEDITSSSLANRKTKETEQQLRAMVLESPVGICILDAETLKSEVVNDSFAEIAGKAHDEIEGHYYWDSFSEVKHLFKDALNQVIATGNVFYADEAEVELIRHGQKETVYLTFVYAPLTDIEGKVIKVAVWVQNQTKQVKIRKSLIVSERNLRLLILQAPVAIGIFKGPQHRVEIANKFSLELWGRTESEVLNRPILEAMPELSSQGIKELLDEVFQTGTPYTNKELPVKLKRDGELRAFYVNVTYQPLFDENGDINGIMTIGFDVTWQVEARKKLEESEHSIRNLVESAPFPIAVIEGQEMKITFANATMMEIWGKGNNVVGKLYRDVLPEFEQQKIFVQILEVLNTGKPFHANNQHITIDKGGQLESYYFNYSFTPLVDSNGNNFAVMATAADVTDIHIAQQKIQDTEAKFRNSVKQAPLAIAIFRGRDYKAEMANKSYLELIGKTEEEFLGKPMFESIPEVEESLSQILADMYKTGESYHGYEFPVNFDGRSPNETSYFNFVYHPLLEDNEISGFMVVATEVTANVKAKQLIKENEEKLKLVIEASELGVYDVDIKLDKIVASERCYTLLGFGDKRDLHYRDLIDNLHPEDLRTRNKAIEQGVKTGKIHYQARFIHNDKSVHWIDARAKLFYDDQKLPARILGTVRDITEERMFQQELLEREEKFRLLAEAVPQYIWTADAEGKVTYFNQALYDYTGLSAEELTNHGWTKMVHPDDREANLNVWKEAVKTGNDYLFEQRFRKHDGEYRWQLTRAIPQKDSEGRIKMWVGSSTDIQQQKMFTSELEKMVEQRTNELQKNNRDLEKMNEELQSFVYISSHDLQEPLRKIQTFASLILETEYEQLSESVKTYFSRMQKSAFRMQNLIKDLIAYSRTNSEDIKFEVVNLLDIIEDVKETLSEELEQVELNFELHNICDIKMIPVQFKQVILNLVSNSIKFSKKEELTHIEIDCQIKKGSQTGIEELSPEKEYCHIQYSDNGIGFEPQYAEKIFDVFQRLHSKEDYIGTGIGLAIVKRIIENHEGLINATGKLGEGATFDMYIPAN